MNKVIALVGMCGAGKSVVSDFYKERNYGYIHFGAVTMEEVKRRGMEVNEVNEKIVREGLRAEHGMAAFAILNLPKIESALENGNVIVDGLYSWAEYKVLKDKFDDSLIVLAVFASRGLRYKRLAERNVRPLTEEQARGRDYAEIENIEKGGPIAMADYTVVNDGNLEDLRDKLESLIY
ncbi:AAA family ATPase [Patescibacteria group bacterium]|nr:AAA family ATPase [Patescibacteria group bacterium]